MELVLDQQKNNSSSIFLNPVGSVKDFGLDLGMHVADFGAGAGHFTKAIANAVGGSGVVSAVDIKRSSLEVIDGIKKIDGLFQIRTVQGNLEQKGGSNLEDNSQDLVLCSNILHQVDNPSVILEEACRVLKPKGFLVVIDWFEKAILGPLNRISKEDIDKLAVSVGFKKDREIDAGGLHYGVIFKKSNKI